MNEPVWRSGRFWLILGLVVAAMVLGALHNSAINTGANDQSAQPWSRIVAPFQKITHTVQQATVDFSYGLIHARALTAENRRLNQRSASRATDKLRLKELSIENEALRRALAIMQSTKPQPIVTEPLSIRPSNYFHSIVLNKGSQQGIKPRYIVAAEGGVVGIVESVTSNTATVLLITDPNASVAGRVQRQESRALGVCKGRGTDSIVLTYLEKDADVRVGDVVVSSGEGGLYPKGLPIGVVQSRAEMKEAGMREAVIQPFVNPRRVDIFYVLPSGL
ncbi:MAG: rod shape-determining protein MreC [Armatimonadota bacterium]